MMKRPTGTSAWVLSAFAVLCVLWGAYYLAFTLSDERGPERTRQTTVTENERAPAKRTGDGPVDGPRGGENPIP